jgi:hypothetical protein
MCNPFISSRYFRELPIMKGRIIYRRSAITISTIVLSILLLTKCIDKTKKKTEEKESVKKQYSGSKACINCHKVVYDSHVSTAHYLTSQPSTREYIKGSFEPENNSFAFSPFVKVAMEKRKDSFYQVEYMNGIEKRKQRFDITVGSGKVGQSYLSWRGNRLVQLPITFFTPANQWSNSPGYPGKVVFNRPITSRCLECHSTWVEVMSNPSREPEEFNHANMIYGVDCEKCHGPAGQHVQFQTENPAETQAKYIINPSSFSRQQKLDMCALCHGGQLTKTKSSFSFEAGDKLSDYFTIDTLSPNSMSIDVHGNQYGLLRSSKCFTQSDMTCNSCHNSHQNESDKMEVFSQRCMSCHNNQHNSSCKMTATIGPSIMQNCIDCHMPKQKSMAIVVLLQGADAPTPAQLRSHYIAIYPEETSKVMAELKK